MTKDKFINEQIQNGNVLDLYCGVKLKPTYELKVPEGQIPKKFRDKITNKLRHLGYKYSPIWDIYFMSI
jgi:hypothetical protein